MDQQNSCIVVLVTAKDKDEARKIADGLLSSRLVACANIIDGVHSVFWWQGRVDDAQETLLVLKSKAALMDQIVEKVKSLHSYETPEIIALPISAGSIPYLNWIQESVKSP